MGGGGFRAPALLHLLHAGEITISLFRWLCAMYLSDEGSSVRSQCAELGKFGVRSTVVVMLMPCPRRVSGWNLGLPRELWLSALGDPQANKVDLSGDIVASPWAHHG
eukprot:UN4138